jgi:hypothetical protein
MSQNLSVLFKAGLDKSFNLVIDNSPSYYDKIFHTIDTDKRVYDMQGWETFKLATARTPGEQIRMDFINPSFSKRFVMVSYGIGTMIDQESWDDDQYGVLSRVIPAKGRAFADAFTVTKEVVAARLFNNYGFASGTGIPGSPDGYSLFSTQHPTSLNNPATQSNRPSVDADLSMSSLQAAVTNLEQQIAPNGVTIMNNRAAKLVVNNDLKYVAKRLCRGGWNPDTADRTVNYIPDDDITPIFWKYFRSNGATGTRNSWFLLGETHHLYWINRQDVRFASDKLVGTNSILFVATARWDCGWADYRGTYGSPGT